MSIKIECILDCQNHLGEGPVWDVDEGRLYWVDGTGRRVGKPELWRMDPKSGKVENWTLGEHDVGAMALRAGGGAVMALDDGFYFFDYDKAEMELITKVDPEQPRTRLNDGKCDRRGRFFAGGMDDKEELTICGLWRLDPDLSVTKADGGIICTNGPCWSPDDKTFYLADSFQEEFWAYDYDIETGSLSNKRVFASTKDDAGVADGSTVDEEGCLWNAQVIGGELVRYAPDGSVERRIGMPVKNVTSVMFGGDNLDVLYVTSMARVQHPAVHEMFAVEAKPQFLAGGLFTGLGIRGTGAPLRRRYKSAISGGLRVPRDSPADSPRCHRQSSARAPPEALRADEPCGRLLAPSRTGRGRAPQARNAPGLADEVVGVGLGLDGARLGLVHHVGEAPALGVGDRLLLGGEAQLDLLRGVVGACPAHQTVHRTVAARRVLEHPAAGLRVA